MFTDEFNNILQKRSLKPYHVAKNTGISPGLMSEYANGVKLPTVANLVKIADYLNCSVDLLLGREQKNNAPNDVRSAIIARVKALPDDRLDRLLGYLEALAAE